jgi:7,8-dihydropterin-6-yl-methyl-4-(beta-D-ribofuranosyl)aminobenzene 5'-phosphate synthase
MLVKALVENTSVSDDLKYEHGLSLFVETNAHTLLFDTGATGLFAENAVKMGVDLASVDTVVISHGHHDHGGGLETLLSINSKAKIYVRDNAFEPHYANKPDGTKANIGLNEALRSGNRFVFTGDKLVIDEELTLFSNVRGSQFNPSGNIDLLKKWGSGFQCDDFSHEQNLIVKENGKTTLLAGCAHCGIVNILEYMRAETGFVPNVVIGGFHLFNPNSKQSEDPAVVTEIGRYLLGTGARFYTCHCTGFESYERLKDIMGEKINYLSGGGDITV